MPTTTAGPRISGPPRPLQCGRCRRFFPRESTPELSDDLVWWACPPCHAKLFTNASAAAAPVATADVGGA
jgi:hypothetical protein